jgi:hypothetical protein
LLYHHLGYSWPAFLLFFMAPDLAMFAYLRGPRFGATIYNAAHSYLGPALLLVHAQLTASESCQAALIWCAHIGFCRTARFGLKYEDSFDHTHLGPAPFNLPHFLAALLHRKA